MLDDTVPRVRGINAVGMSPWCPARHGREALLLSCGALCELAESHVGLEMKIARQPVADLAT